jgi:hypothetical protein
MSHTQNHERIRSTTVLRRYVDLALVQSDRCRR